MFADTRSWCQIETWRTSPLRHGDGSGRRQIEGSVLGLAQIATVHPPCSVLKGMFRNGIVAAPEPPRGLPAHQCDWQASFAAMAVLSYGLIPLSSGVSLSAAGLCAARLCRLCCPGTSRYAERLSAPSRVIR